MPRLLRALRNALAVLALISLSAPALASATDSRDAERRVNVNLASTADLTAVPGLDAQRAEAIVAYRTANGPFTVLDDLRRVEGMTPGLVKAVRDLLTVDGQDRRAIPSPERSRTLR